MEPIKEVEDEDKDRDKSDIQLQEQRSSNPFQLKSKVADSAENNQRNRSEEEIKQNYIIKHPFDSESEDSVTDSDLDQGDEKKIINDINKTFCQKFAQLLTNGPFILILFSISFLYFIITGIQYWVSDYLLTVLKVDQETVFTSFGIISITGPVLGVIVGGNVTSYLGGYNSKASLKVANIVSFLCLVSAAPIAFIDSFPLFAGLLWFLLFFGGSVLPCMTGIMLNTVDKHFKTTANSIANLIYNLVGYLPAPTVYGLIYDAGEGGNARHAMATLMFTPILCIVFFSIASILIIKNDVLGYKEQEAQQQIVDEELRYLDLAADI